MHQTASFNQVAKTRHAAVPRHVAIVMDGNGRWAKQRMLPRTMGHREGVKAVRRVVKACYERGVEMLTLFAFSSENCADGFVPDDLAHRNQALE